MAPQPPFGYLRMIEIVSEVVGHAEALHDATRALIGRNRQGNDIA